MTSPPVPAHINGALRKLHVSEVNTEWRCIYMIRFSRDDTLRSHMRAHMHVARRHRALIEQRLTPGLRSIFRWLAPVTSLYPGTLLPLLSSQWSAATEIVLTAAKLSDYTELASLLNQREDQQGLLTTIKKIQADTQYACDALRPLDNEKHSVALEGWLRSIALYRMVVKKII